MSARISSDDLEFFNKISLAMEAYVWSGEIQMFVHVVLCTDYVNGGLQNAGLPVYTTLPV